MTKIITEKKCGGCKQIKPISEYYKKGNGFRSLSISCYNEHSKKDYLKNKERDDKRHKEYDKAHPEIGRRKTKKWRLANLDKVKEYAKEYRKSKLQYFFEYKQKFYLERPDYRKQYYENHKKEYLGYWRNRRARKLNTEGQITPQEWQQVKDKYGNKCLYPGCNNKNVTMDHVIPLVNGGTHTIDNVQPLCLFHNLRKHTKTIDYR